MSAARTPLVPALLGAVAFLGACGAAGTQTMPSPAPPRTIPPPGPSSGSAGAGCQTGARSVRVTSSANGRTVTLAVGCGLEVDLSSENGIWSGPVEAGPRLLRQLGIPRQAGGSVGVAYRAVRRGKTELRAFERPLCRPAHACPQFILQWQLHVRVVR